MHHAHTASAATACRFDDDGIADFLRDTQRLGFVFRQRAVRTGNSGHARFFHRVFGGNLVTHQANYISVRANEGKTRLFNALGEISIFGQKAVTGVDAVSACHFSRCDEGWNAQVGLGCRRRANAHRFIC